MEQVEPLTKESARHGKRVLSDIHETIDGYHALLIDGKQQTLVKGTWAFAPRLSWYIPTTGKYVVIGGYWQER